MAEPKVVTNPVSLSKRDVDILVSALATYGAVLQRRINSEVNLDIKKLLNADIDGVVELKVRLQR